MTIFTAHWHHDLLRLTAQEMLRRYDAEALPNILVLMPNRRSCIAMREAFRGLTGEQTVLLPRIVPLGDAENELLMAFARGQHEAEEALTSLPPAMSQWQHRMLLAELVRAFETKRTGIAPSLHHVLALTDDLIDIQQNLIREGIDIAEVNVSRVAFPDMAQHWQVNAAFLDILFKEWPYIERERGLVTRAGREQALLKAMNATWKHTPPPYPVWMVGSTGSMPAVRELMSTIHHVPNGFVVLPELDITPSSNVAIGHPQYYVQQAMHAMGATQDSVELLGGQGVTPRQKLWLGEDGHDVSGIQCVTCAHEEEEAGVISLMVREALDASGKTVAVITPAPALMQRVRLHLRRYDIHVNTPQGLPLANEPAGQVWSYVLRCLSDEVGTLSLLDLLHAEGVNCGEDVLNWQSFLRKWRGKCRGIIGQSSASERIRRLSSEFSIAATVSRIVHDLEGLHKQRFTLSEWLTHIRAIIDSLVPEKLNGHEAILELVEELSLASNSMKLDVDDMVALMQEALMKPVRSPDFAAHPRVFVLSPMEARLQRFDRVILAGFNEGDWPQAYQPSPWLNLGQRASLGMTPPEAHATLTAHDLLMLGMAPELFITRSAKSEGSPSTASRYLVKLDVQLQRAGVKLVSYPWRHWWADLNKTDYLPIEAEAPAPVTRPSTLRVTSLRHLFTDPYAIYAEYVLGLKQLDPYNQAPDARTFGSLVHKVIEDMIANDKSPDDADWLLAHVTHLESDARLYSLWLPRIRNILRFVAAVHAERSFSELEMETKKEVNIGEVTLVGKIDRLENQGAAYSIHDYKTGDAPEKKAMKLGLEPQLIAYALMLSQETGALPESLVYWALPKARHQGALVPYEFGDSTLAGHIAALGTAIGSMFAEGYAFYALDAESPYAAVSRNEEWAA